MFKPLSVWKYLLNNRQQAGVVFMVTCLSSVLQILLLFYTNTTIRLLRRTTIEPWTAMTYTGCIGSSNETRVKQALLRNTLAHHPAVARVLPYNDIATVMNGIAPTEFLFIDAAEIHPLLDHLRLKLVDGRLPAPGSREIIMHWELAANKGLKIGDRFGDQISKLELLPGEFRLVGLLDGKTILGFADLGCLTTEYHVSKTDCGLLAIPRPGRLSQVKHFLVQLKNRDKDVYNSGSNEKNAYENYGIFLMVSNVIYFALAAIVTLCVSFLFFLYFYKRRSEFGMLEALGHTRKKILGRTFQEIAGVSLFGFGLGAVLALLGGWLLNRLFFIKLGLPMVLWDPSYPGKLLPIPPLITISSLLPVWRMLGKVDPIALTEGEE